MLRTTFDDQADELSAEFEPFQVWVDLRPIDDGDQHFHARLPGWTPGQIISAYDALSMRDKLIMWTRSHS